jgi:PAS domain S-box-containing protein
VFLAVLTALYFFAGKLGLALASIHASASAVWPPTGMALAAGLLFGLRVWPAILLGAFLVNVTTAGSVATSVGIAIGNTLEAVVGTWLVTRFAGGVSAFERPQGVLRFTSLALLATTLSATVGVLTLLAGGYAVASHAPAIWFTWWLGDAVGALVFAPLIVLWVRPGTRDRVPGHVFEAACLALTVLVAGAIMFTRLEPVAFAAIPPLVWAALRFGRRGAVTAAFGMSAIALWGTLRSLGPFAGDSINESLLFLQAFVGVVTLTALVLASGTRERERAEAALRRSHENLEEQVRMRTASLTEAVEDLQRSRSVLDEGQKVAHLGSWEWDIRANAVAWSDELFRIYGLTPGSVDITYQAYHERVHPEDREHAALSIRRALEGGREFDFEERIVRPDGEVRTLRSKGFVVRDEAGLPQRMVGTCHDVTELKHVEIELQKRVEALDRSNTELSLLSYAASHDLKEPLRTVASNVQLIGRRLDELDVPELERPARFAIDGVRRMEELINDLLAYSTADRPSSVEADAQSALAEAVQRLTAQISDSGARIEAGPLPRVVAGPARLVGLLQNLISNAIKYGHDGRTTEIRVSAEREDDMWRFEVTDNGRGFEPADAERVFVIFVRLDGDRGVPGTGLGLAICRRIVEAQGGRIWAESEPGRGSVFRFTLPAATGPGGSAGPRPP